MTPPSLWDRVRRARIVQVLVVYLGASWGVLQIADTLSEALSLPEWVAPVAIILLMVGMVIILATAWVQSLDSTTQAEEAGEVPTDWEVAPTTRKPTPSNTTVTGPSQSGSASTPISVSTSCNTPHDAAR